MAHQFSLEAVLRLRQSLERQQELMLRDANQQMNALEQRIESVNTQLSQRADQESLYLTFGLSGAELQFSGLARSTLLAQCQNLEKRLVTAQQVRDARLASFRQARQQREVMESLRENQRQAYLLDQTRQNQRHLDDLLLLRRAYLRRS